MRRLFAIVLLLSTLGASTPAPDLTGTWQGVITVPGLGSNRRVMVVTKHAGTYDVAIHSIDETDVPIVSNDVAVDGRNVVMKFDMNADPWFDYHRIYKARLSSDGSTLAGSWSVRGDKMTVDMKYTRVAHATWPIFQPVTRMVEVEPGVRVEVLDWGGTGRSLFFLAGAGNTGHDFFALVQKLRHKYHVYSMTRRGFGNSSKPPFTSKNYSADRLGDDVVAAIDAMNMQKPVLIGHSIGGEELSDVGTRYPDKVSALIYLDAGYFYAFGPGTRPARMTLPPNAPLELRAVLDGVRAFQDPINLPILAIFAYPKDYSHLPKEQRTPSKIKENNADDEAEIDRFANGLPNAKIVRIANADHFIYLSNPAEVLRDIEAFIAGLPKN